jgi:hypothetical protein
VVLQRKTWGDLCGLSEKGARGVGHATVYEEAARGQSLSPDSFYQHDNGMGKSWALALQSQCSTISGPRLRFHPGEGLLLFVCQHATTRALCRASYIV